MGGRVAATLAVACTVGLTACFAARPAAPATVGRFDTAAAWRFLRWQVALGPRPAGSPASRRLAARIKSQLPHGRYEAVPHGLRNVIGTVRGRDASRIVVVGAHYDTKDLPGFVGADDGASGTAVVLELARAFKPRDTRATLVFAFFDGEETPRGTPNTERAFARYGLRGSKVAARAFRRARAMILLDMVGDRYLELPRETSSNVELFGRLRAAAQRAGTGTYFPLIREPTVLDDHTPFQREGVPAIDVIDFTFPCWHRRCDNLHAVSRDSIGVVGRTLVELLRTF